MKEIDWEKWDHMVGKFPDDLLAREIGCEAKDIEQRRADRSIPAFGGGAMPIEIGKPLGDGGRYEFKLDSRKK